MRLSPEADAVLSRGTFCSLAARAGERIHLTPVVFVRHRDRLWLTTSRASVKARAWRRDAVTAGIVEADGLAVSFRGRVRMYDLLDPSTWRESARRSPLLTAAAARFTLKNGRFFAGYARDAHRVPLAWTPPARVFASVELESAALLDVSAGRLLERWGTWPSGARSGAGDAAEPVVTLDDPLGRLPDDVREAVGSSGDGSAALGRAIVPCSWYRTASGTLRVGVADGFLELAGGRPALAGPAALSAQRPSAWRAREMRGFLAQGRVRRRSGGLTLVAQRLVWWSGWSTGTVRP